MTEILIQRMKEEDLPEVLGIEALSFTAPWSEALFRIELQSPLSHPVVARHQGRIAGYLCANLVLDEAQILDLAVQPVLRRQGIASALIRETLAYLRGKGCRAVFLEVRASNRPALDMYAAEGFEVTGTRKNYYTSPPEDAITMVLKF
ncbi:MAG: ribosomal protein S18-alanine N-acetyltransferase [Thermodesulfovibrionales bacterium]